MAVQFVLLAASVALTWIIFGPSKTRFATKEKLPEAEKSLFGEINRIRSSGVTDDELAEAKRELSSRYQMAMQSNEFFTFNFAVEELRGLGYDNVYKYEAEIEKLTKEDLKVAANKYLDMDKSVEVVISPG